MTSLGHFFFTRLIFQPFNHLIKGYSLTQRKIQQLFRTGEIMRASSEVAHMIALNPSIKRTRAVIWHDIAHNITPVTALRIGACNAT